MLLCIENIMRDVHTLEHSRDRLRYFNTCRTYQDRSAKFAILLYFLDKSIILLAFRAIDIIISVITSNRFVRWDNDHVKLVYLEEFARFRFGSTCHAGKFVVESEVVLQRNGRSEERRVGKECRARWLPLH